MQIGSEIIESYSNPQSLAQTAEVADRRPLTHDGPNIVKQE